MGVKPGRQLGITRQMRGGKQHWKPSNAQNLEVRLFTIGSLSFLFFFHSFRPTIEILKFSDPDKKPHESRKKRKEKKLESGIWDMGSETMIFLMS